MDSIINIIHNDPVIVCYQNLLVLVVRTSVIYHLIIWVFNFCGPDNTHMGLTWMKSTGISYNSNNPLSSFGTIHTIIIYDNTSASIGIYFTIQWWKLWTAPYEFHLSTFNMISLNIVKFELWFRFRFFILLYPLSTFCSVFYFKFQSIN